MKQPKPSEAPVDRPKKGADALKAVARHAAAAGTEKNRSSMRILVIEDHDDTRRSIQRLLEFCGHRVSSAASAAQALEIAAGSQFDLVLSDLGLPDQTGHELMAQLHRLYGLSGIALSGYDGEENTDRNRAAGFRAHLTKPIKFEQLEALLTEFSRFIP